MSPTRSASWRQRPGQETIAGDGTGDNPNGSTPKRDAARERESEEIDPDPRKEISRLITPFAKPVPRDQPRTAPPRTRESPRRRKSRARRDDGNRTDREAEGNSLRRQRHWACLLAAPSGAAGDRAGHAEPGAGRPDDPKHSGPNGYADQRKICRQCARVRAYRRNAGARLERRAAPRRTIAREPEIACNSRPTISTPPRPAITSRI